MRVNLRELAARADGNPATPLQEAAGDLSDYEIFHNLVLVATYVAPEKIGSIIVTDNRQAEDRREASRGPSWRLKRSRWCSSSIPGRSIDRTHLDTDPGTAGRTSESSSGPLATTCSTTSSGEAWSPIGASGSHPVGCRVHSPASDDQPRFVHEPLIERPPSYAGLRIQSSLHLYSVPSVMLITRPSPALSKPLTDVT